MQLDALNAVAAQFILRDRKIGRGTRTSTVAAAALLPGVLGLALPLAVARRSRPSTPSTGEGVLVPSLSHGGHTFEEAQKILEHVRLIAGEVRAYSADAGHNMVMGQDPEAGTIVPLDSTVTVIVSDGRPPKSDTGDTSTEIDRDLTLKLARAKHEIEGRIAASEERVLDAIRGNYIGGATGDTIKS